MIFIIADTFQTALGKLDNASQKAAKMCAFELQLDPTGDGKHFHRIDRSKDKNFWSVRANSDIRIIVHKTGDRFTLCYVDHHDAAYAWAERRVFEIHPITHALQIVELVEKVREVQPDLIPDLVDLARVPIVPITPPPLAHLNEAILLEYGVPPQWVEPLLKADESRLLDFVDHLPAEAFEAVLSFAIGETPVAPAKRAPDMQHPDEQRRFRIIEGIEELEQALNYPWDKWSVYLHPSQRALVDADFAGPARVAGSAGTGKTVVALHRAARMAKKSGTRVLLTTFSRPLAAALQRKVNILNGDEARIAPNIHVASFREAAAELYELNIGHKPMLTTDGHIRKHLDAVAPTEDRVFLLSEWTEVVDAWQIVDEGTYLDTPRKGRRSRVSRNERARIWPIFAKLREAIFRSGRVTEPEMFAAVENQFRQRSDKPFTHIVVDEAQDLGVPELRFLAAVAPPTPDALFFAGDLGQRIFKAPFSWAALGVDVEGRSTTLKVNYRTSHQVRTASDRLLPETIQDIDGREEDRSGTISVFNGPVPEIERFEDEEAERDHVAAWLRKALDEDIPIIELGVIVRSDDALQRARQVAQVLGLPHQTLTETMTVKANALPIGVMHLAKGLEFRCVAVMACDDDLLPLRSRVDQVTTEEDLDEVYATERHLLYVACTRARERLLVSGVKPVSEFLADLAP